MKPTLLRRLSALACAGVACTCAAAPALAHDFWVEPDRFQTAANVALPFTLRVGHGMLRQRSQLPERRIIRFSALGPNRAMFDLRAGLAFGSQDSDGVLRFEIPGAYAVVLQTDSAAQSHLPAERFNDYLRAEGLTPALAERGRTHRMNMDGSERYSRQAKAIVEVGETAGRAQSAVTAQFGLPLEIVLDQNPFARPQPQTLPVRVYYQGRPLAGALVKFTDLANDAAPFETQLTDHDGRARFSMPQQGHWLLNVIWTRALPASEETDFETIFSSLSFGFDAR